MKDTAEIRAPEPVVLRPGRLGSAGPTVGRAPVAAEHLDVRFCMRRAPSERQRSTAASSAGLHLDLLQFFKPAASGESSDSCRSHTCSLQPAAPAVNGVRSFSSIHRQPCLCQGARRLRRPATARTARHARTACSSELSCARRLRACAPCIEWSSTPHTCRIDTPHVAPIRAPTPTECRSPVPLI